MPSKSHRKTSLANLKSDAVFNERRTLRRAMSSIQRSDDGLEVAIVDVFSLFRLLKFNSSPLTPSGSEALSHFDQAHELIGDARRLLSEANLHLAKVLELSER